MVVIKITCTILEQVQVQYMYYVRGLGEDGKHISLCKKKKKKRTNFFEEGG